MKIEDLLEHCKKLNICDEELICSKVIIAYSMFFRILRVLMRSSSQVQGTGGVIGVYQDTLVLFDLTTFKGIPGKEIFRHPLDDVERYQIKHKLFNDRLKIYINNKKYVFFFRKKDRDLLEQIEKKIKK